MCNDRCLGNFESYYLSKTFHFTVFGQNSYAVEAEAEKLAKYTEAAKHSSPNLLLLEELKAKYLKQ